MKPAYLLASLSSLAALASAAYPGHNACPLSEIFEKLHQIPPGWSIVSRAAVWQTLKLHIALQQSQAYEFESHVLDIATPGHGSYGKHLGREEIKSFLTPSTSAVNEVKTWLKTYGVKDDDLVERGDFLLVKMDVGVAESLLDTEFYSYTDGKTAIIRTLQYSLPATLHQRIRMVQPTTRFGQPLPHHQSLFKHIKAAPPNDTDAFDAIRCAMNVTPACLRAQYMLNNFTAVYDPTNKLAVSGYLDQYARYADFELFSETFAAYANGSTFEIKSVNGGRNLQNSSLDSTEANLDVQYAVTMAPNIDVTFISTPGRGQLKPDLDNPNPNGNTNEPYLEQLLYLLDLPDEDLPTVLSTSYGENEQTVPATYANVTCNLFAQLGARGVSVIFSSGDSGPGQGCQTNDGRNTTRFLPIFPASCPFVTSVGGTTGTNPERAVSFSSGGFLEYFPRPAYQEDAVCTYLSKLGSRWEGLYNAAGRGFPDVSARASGYYIYDHGESQLVSGTSCSAPVFAAIIANLNSIRLSLGWPALGFLNPFLYQFGGEGLMDITKGGSKGCRGIDIVSGTVSHYVPYAGWNATEGWDPVTGLGTPMFTQLVDLMLRYAAPGKK